MKNLVMITSIVSLATLSGCAINQNLHNGYAFYGERSEPIAVTGAAGKSKVGKACTKNYLGIYAVGDNSLEAAKKEGGIHTVSSVDVEVSNIGPFYIHSCTVVHGE
jgi:hypothetical protein